MIRAIWLVVAFAVLLIPGVAWAQGTAVRQDNSFSGAFGGGPTTYTMISPYPPGWVNTRGFRVCGSFSTANTGPATLQIETQSALPIHVQPPTGEVPLTGGEIIGATRCLTVNSGATAFILGDVGGGVTPNPGAHNVTPSEWAYGQNFVCAAACTLTLPASGSLPNQGGITVQTIGASGIATVTPTAASGDGINGGVANAALVLGTNITTMVTLGTPATTTAFLVPPGEDKRYPISWGPGMNLSTSPIPFFTRPLVPVMVSALTCLTGGIGGATPMTVGLVYAPDSTAITAITADPPVAPVYAINSTATRCNAAASPAGVQQNMLPAGAPPVITQGNHVWLVGYGTAWSTSTNLTTISGRVQIAVSP